MIAATLVVLGVATLASAFTLAPLLRRGATDAEPRSAAFGRARELQAERDMLVASLKDLENDRATDKVGDEDYTALQARLSARAIEVMQQLDVLAAERSDAEEAARLASLPLPYPGKGRPGPLR